MFSVGLEHGMKMIDHRADTQDTDGMFLFDREKDRQENEKVPPGVENDDTLDRFLVNVMNGVLSESSSLHGFNRFEAQ